MDNWLNYEIVLLEERNDPAKEKEFILKTIKPFVESNKEEIELFHFTRIFDNSPKRENFIRWRIQPHEKDFKSVKEKIENLLKELKSKKEIIDFRIPPFDIDDIHNKLGGKLENYDLFLKFLDAISKITIELLGRNADNIIPGYIPSPDYYAHFLYNQFGSHSLYYKCPSCAKGSITVHPCRYCGAIILPQSFGLHTL
jgi:hypothetical protein